MSGSVRGVIALTKSDNNVDDKSPGTSFAVICTGAGNVKVKFAGGTTGTYPVAVGLTVFPWAIARVFSTGTTATATYENWY